MAAPDMKQVTED